MLVPLGDTSLWVTRLGAGPPVVCLHGGLGLDHTYFRPWLDPLAAEFELVYCDHRGNGRSARPADWSAVDHGTWVADLEALRRHLGFEQVFLLGHSYGGYFAQEYALAWPERTAGLVLCDTSPAADYGAAMFAGLEGRATPSQLTTLATAFTRPIEVGPEAMRELYLEVLPLYFRDPRPEWLEAVVADMVFSPEAFNRGFLECRPRFRTLERLGEIGCPVLVAAGRHDLIVPPAFGAERLHAGIPGSELVLFEESGHFPFIEEREAFLAVVGEWLGKVAGAWA